MKELYTAPQAELTVFAPVERLANDAWDEVVNNVFSLTRSGSGGVSDSNSDIDVGGSTDPNIDE